MRDQKLQRVAEQLVKLKMAVEKGVSESHEKGSPQNGSSSKVAEATPNLVGGGNASIPPKTKPSETEGSTKAGKSENEYVLPSHVPCLSWIKLKGCNPCCSYVHLGLFWFCVFITMIF